MTKTLTFAIFGNSYQKRRLSVIKDITDFLKGRKAHILIEKPYYDYLTKNCRMNLQISGTFSSSSPVKADYAISMGGDGTFLKTATKIATSNIPILGVNTGRLGFLADVLPDETGKALTAIYEGNYTIVEHTALQIESNGRQITECPYALNDIAVLKRDTASMITIRASVNGEYLVTYQADGLIVSTPTGSTAYSLSNGGPIIVPQTGTFCLTPVAPHSLNIRPIVISDDSIVKLDVESRSHNFLAAIDGRSDTLTEGTEVIIHRAPFTTKIIKRKGYRLFDSLKEKMMWGADKRET